AGFRGVRLPTGLAVVRSDGFVHCVGGARGDPRPADRTPPRRPGLDATGARPAARHLPGGGVSPRVEHERSRRTDGGAAGRPVQGRAPRAGAGHLVRAGQGRTAPVGGLPLHGGGAAAAPVRAGRVPTRAPQRHGPGKSFGRLAHPAQVGVQGRMGQQGAPRRGGRGRPPPDPL
ncbi:MAG: FIG00500878: hypothetical protein, partial [uncultured Acidimicrobiales bacterium]